jgi:hypothetical protein
MIVENWPIPKSSLFPENLQGRRFGLLANHEMLIPEALLLKSKINNNGLRWHRINISLPNNQVVGSENFPYNF